MAPPIQRPGLLPREGLLERLERSDAPVAALLAPAGYGKTTLLSQFFTTTTRDAAWLSLDDEHNDPVVLWSDVSRSLSNSGSLPAGRKPVLDTESAMTRGIDQLLEAISTDAQPVLILDQVGRLDADPPLLVLAALMTKARGHLKVVFASRSARHLPIALLRARGDLFELTMDDLAFDESEIDAVLRSVGVRDPDAAAVSGATEGWPAAVYLTALALKTAGQSPKAATVRGDDVFLVDYLRKELMEELPEDLQSFLVRSSVLPRMTGDLCDFVLETEGSDHLLERLAELNLLVVPIDRQRTWYRYHSLLHDYLRVERERELPEETKGLHGRASLWFENAGYVDLAIEQARLAGEHDRMATLLFRSARTIFDAGRSATLAGWFTWLEEQDVFPQHPELAALGAFTRALTGDVGGAERLSHVVENHHDGRLKDDAGLGPLSRMWRSYWAPRGVEPALVDAQSADEVLRHQPDWAATSLAAAALATSAVEGVVAAEPMWTEVRWRSKSNNSPPTSIVAGAMRGLAAIRSSAWSQAEVHVALATAEIETYGLERYLTSCLAFVASARIAAHGGDLDKGRRHLGAAAALRPLLTAALPVYSVLTLHEMAMAYLECADVAGARRVMRECGDIFVLRPRLGVLVDEHHELRQRLSVLPAGMVGPSSLTPAELRLLPFLVTHLSYPEIGDRLYVSKHTVKTQAMSIYRKLGVSTRSEAVAKARGVGLLSS